MSYSSPEPNNETLPGPQGVSSWPARLISWIGLTLHGLLGVPYVLSGLLAPFWAVVALWTLWAGLLAVVVHQRTRRPVLVAVVPIVGLVFWVVAMWAGSMLFDWAA